MSPRFRGLLFRRRLAKFQPPVFGFVPVPAGFRVGPISREDVIVFCTVLQAVNHLQRIPSLLPGQKTLKRALDAAPSQFENATLTLTSGVFPSSETETIEDTVTPRNMKFLLLLLVVIAGFVSGWSLQTDFIKGAFHVQSQSKVAAAKTRRANNIPSRLLAERKKFEGRLKYEKFKFFDCSWKGREFL